MKNNFKSINQKNLYQNLQFLKEKLPKNCKFCAVVKCDAYGHNAKFICKIIENYVDCFAFSNNKEAVEIKQILPHKRCLVIGAFSLEDLQNAINLGVEISVENAEQLQKIDKYAQQLNKKAFVQVKIDTGMRRLGVYNLVELKQILKVANELQNLEITGIFSHFGSGDRIECTRTQLQFQKFLSFINQCDKKLEFHICNSVNTFNHSIYCLDMVRCGIGLYGYGIEGVKPVESVFAKIVAIKKVSKGEFLGYGNRHKAKRDMTIGIVNIGYGQGLPRCYSRGGYFLVNGIRAKIVAEICMDMTFIDISKIQSVKEGDLATILGTSKELNADTIAKICGTIPYEILTNFKNIPLL